MTQPYKILIGIIGTIVVVGFMLGVFGFIKGLQNTENSSSFRLPDIGVRVPADWYEHRLSDTHIILTKQEKLPDIGATEGYAYGEQINISVLPFEGDPMRPEDWEQLAWIEDEALVKETLWTSVGNRQVLQVRHEAGGASGGQITWYIFDDNRAYELSLYPAENTENLKPFSEFVNRYADYLSGQTSEISKKVSDFTDAIQGFVLKNFGQPIEGFNAQIYLQAFPGLLEADFDGVETREGIYSYANGELSFERTKSQPISSAEEMILEQGHRTFFENVRERLGSDLPVDEIMKVLVAQGVGKVTGTIFSGPTCPVLRDPPDPQCADKPVFGIFIVKDIAGISEIARFGTQRDGTFTTTLPAGEYSIEPETPLGVGIQSHRIEVRANETSKYTIMFDTGIR